MKDIKYIQTHHLTAIIVEGDYIKLVIYSRTRSPYGWNKRNVIHSPFGVDEDKFTFKYVKKQIKEVYIDFPDNEIKELITKINKYYDKSKKQVG